MPREVTNSNVDLPPCQISKCCTRSERDCPNAEGGEPCEALLDVESNPISLKKRKILVEPTSLEASELEKVANGIRVCLVPFQIY
jgi:hypothetical protein